MQVLPAPVRFKRSGGPPQFSPGMTLAERIAQMKLQGAPMVPMQAGPVEMPPQLIEPGPTDPREALKAAALDAALENVRASQNGGDLRGAMGLNPDGGPNLPRRSYNFPTPPEARDLPESPRYRKDNPLLGAVLALLAGRFIGGSKNAGYAAAGGFLQGHQVGTDRRFSNAVGDFERRTERSRFQSAQDRQGFTDKFAPVKAQQEADSDADRLAIADWTAQGTARRADQKLGDDQAKARGAAESDKLKARGKFFDDLTALAPDAQQARLAQADRDGDLGRLGIIAKRDEETGLYDVATLEKAAPKAAEPSEAASKSRALLIQLNRNYQMFLDPHLSTEGVAKIGREIKRIEGELGTSNGEETIGDVLGQYTPAERATIQARRASLGETVRAHKVGEKQRGQGLVIAGRNATTAERNAAAREAGKTGAGAKGKETVWEASGTDFVDPIGAPPGFALRAGLKPHVAGGVQRTNVALRSSYPSLRIAGASGGDTVVYDLGTEKQPAPPFKMLSFANSVRGLPGVASATYDRKAGRVVVRYGATVGGKPKFVAPSSSSSSGAAPRKVEVGGRSYSIRVKGAK